MNNKYWEQRVGIHLLHFKQFGNDTIIATLYLDCDAWYYSSMVTVAEHELLDSDNLGEAKQDVEAIVEECYRQKVKHYSELLKQWLENEDSAHEMEERLTNGVNGIVESLQTKFFENYNKEVYGMQCKRDGYVKGISDFKTKANALILDILEEHQ